MATLPHVGVIVGVRVGVAVGGVPVTVCVGVKVGPVVNTTFSFGAPKRASPPTKVISFSPPGSPPLTVHRSAVNPVLLILASGAVSANVLIVQGGDA